MKLEGFIGARRADNEPRWLALLAAALGQSHPSDELKAAVEGLLVKPRGNNHRVEDRTRGPAA